MIQKKILPILSVVAIAAQILIVEAHSSLAKITNLNSRLAQLNTSGNELDNTSTNSVHPKNIRFSRRYAYKYKFECTPDNQTELAIYQARRNRQGQIIGLWKKAANRPLIQWTQTGSLEFGEKYPPEVRCQAVTDRFNQHFLRGGKPKMPPLSEGILNGMAVVCAAKAGACNSSNLLWTLRSNNRGTNGKIMISLVSSLKGDASSSLIFESTDLVDVKNQGDEWVEKLAVIDDSLKAASVNQEKILEVDMEKLIEEAITEEQKKLEIEE
ncbi:COP23 domain-containing protein [Hydrocoleum sp. CS-953]|uniref:COP23 domain-containing protein n=1 Tax=Microcoleaceae TaxID=1892252 RepID=UPI000B9A41A6|nr:COP23 domain-containing protein [Hydrocoleum sp. CS-953]